MRPDPPLPPAGHTWPDRVAQHIQDPVRRLKFLRAVAPAALRATDRPKRIWSIAAVPALFAAVLIAWLTTMALRGSPHTALVSPVSPAGPELTPAVTPRTSPADVWLVDRAGEIETYSNGLRIDNRFLTSTRRRSYVAFPTRGGPPERAADPAGIVFHTTESRIAPFEAAQNGVLKRLGESLLEYVRRRQSYNFVIDRFGRVYRVVPEEEVAYHSGYSVWADDRRLYLNLNESFLGVSFEAANAAGRPPETSSAQARSAEMLVELLRRRFRIPPSSCVTHAQVSVNPSNMRVGYHVDWAAGFPFQSVGLPDNNGAPLPSLWAYGFEADAKFLGAAGPPLREAVARAQAAFEAQAAAAGLPPAAYRAALHRRYRELLARARSQKAVDERAE